MTIYYTPYAPIPDRGALTTLMPPARRARLEGTHPGPLFTYALLALALDREQGITTREVLAYTAQGKPYLPGCGVYLSLSHSKTHALAALAPYPVGCDIETHRPISAGLRRRVLGDAGSDADFFAYWTLRESYFKLCGVNACPSEREAAWWQYREIPGCTATVAAAEAFPRPELQHISPETLFSFADENGA